MMTVRAKSSCTDKSQAFINVHIRMHTRTLTWLIHDFHIRYAILRLANYNIRPHKVNF